MYQVVQFLSYLHFMYVKLPSLIGKVILINVSFYSFANQSVTMV